MRELLIANSDISVAAIVISLLIGFVLALILRWHFIKFGSSFSNKRELSSIFPFIVLTITLVIAIVKSSLALSLGLVGALSIVRFRTPIKEPEELAYIFMAIAIGLGLGAERLEITVVATLLILSAIAVFQHFTQKKVARSLYLSVSSSAEGAEINIEELSKLVEKEIKTCDLQRFDTKEGAFNSIFYINTDDSDKVFSLIKKLETEYPKAEITLIDQHKIPGL